MKKLKVGIIFGGMSTEHDISVVSGTSIIKNMNKSIYNIYPIYIDTNGIWYSYDKKIEDINILKVREKPTEITKLENVIGYLKQLDVIFPVMHGLYGEDGTIQGLFELLKIPYVGCKVLGSCVCMDKAYTKVVLEKAQIPQVKHMYIKEYKNQYIYVNDNFEEEKFDIKNLSEKVKEKLGLPVFIKPSNSGSSVGVNKASTLEEVQKFIQTAAEFDKKIIIEESINAREIECAVIGNEEVEASILGEILPAEEFYSFDAKYINSESKTKMPAEISEEQTNYIKNMAIKAFKAVDGKGLSRVDFFMDKDSGKIYLNEINTMPGFTTISMYPQLFEKCGLSYSNLIDKLINLAVEE
ncbi:MAG: D-alanine--D-alanine ligase [Clostridia bacterium]|nr:D-alanine--D-alanine ligase [Clostridia bacterium]